MYLIGLLMSKPHKTTPDAFEKVIVYLPRKSVQILREASYEMRLPLTRLVAIAFDNELDSPKPFTYRCDMPETYREYLYAGEASRILDFLNRAPNGADLQHLMLCRRDIGIDDRLTLMGAIQELLEKGLIKFYKPIRVTFPYDRDYKRLRVVQPDKKLMKHRKFRRIEGISTKYMRPAKDDE